MCIQNSNCRIPHNTYRSSVTAVTQSPQSSCVLTWALPSTTTARVLLLLTTEPGLILFCATLCILQLKQYSFIGMGVHNTLPKEQQCPSFDQAHSNYRQPGQRLVKSPSKYNVHRRSKSEPQHKYYQLPELFFSRTFLCFIPKHRPRAADPPHVHRRAPEGSSRINGQVLGSSSSPKKHDWFWQQSKARGNSHRNSAAVLNPPLEITTMGVMRRSLK